MNTTPGVTGVLAVVLVVLVVGTLVRAVQTPLGRADATRWGSLAVWWGLGIVLLLCVVVGWPLVFGLMVVLSGVGLWEYARVRGGRGVVMWVLLGVLWAGHYALVWWADAAGPWLWAWALPVAAVALLCVRQILADRAEGFTTRVGGDLLGVLLVVYGLSFTAVLARPVGEQPGVGWGIGALIMLVLVTYAADIAAAWWGKALGRRKVLPTVSPNKTWLGVFAGVLTAIAAGAVLWPALELPPAGWTVPLRCVVGVGAGLVLGIGAFFGDAIFSAFKRDHGLKTTGRLFPGQGGVLDRWDSLTLNGPLLFAYLSLIA